MTGDAEGVLDLFTTDAAYDETPFATNLRGHDENRQQRLDNATHGQTGVVFGVEI